MINTPENNADIQQARSLEAHLWQLVKQGDAQQAVNVCRQLNLEFPQYSPGWFSASRLMMQLNNPKAALQAIDKALAIDKEHSAWLIQKALVISALGQTEQLETIVGHLQEHRLDSAYQNSTLGLLLTRLERRPEAVNWYKKAVSLEPNQGRHYYNLAVLQRSLGQFEEAEKNFDQAIKRSPKDWEAYKIRADIRTQTAERNHIGQLEDALIKAQADPRGQVQICFALAKELEDLSEWDQSFRYLDQGARSRRAMMQYDSQRDLETMAEIRRVFSADRFNQPVTGYDNSEPIFIIGMPRTGTTLVERILAAHTDVHPAGELNNFTMQLMAQAQKENPGQKPDRNRLVELTAELDFTALGRNYIDSTRPLSGHTPRFIDKLPLNFLYAGLIHMALPNARIINLKRHPLDTCYAVYKQLFVDAYPFSYDLEELGRYYAAYESLMDHWNQVMPGVIHTVAYEDVVANTEGEARSLLEYCGLDWQERCLRFYENKEAATTASSAQVRKPVYSSSVDKWRHYEEHLAPLIEVLISEGVALEA